MTSFVVHSITATFVVPEVNAVLDIDEYLE
jgi:hypothetical protein